MSETCRVIINQVKQKLHRVGYLPIQYYKDARYHEHKTQFNIVNITMRLLCDIKLHVSVLAETQGFLLLSSDYTASNHKITN